MAKKILLADDSITIQKVISITFASENYELMVVGDGETAVRKIKEAKPDLVLADVAMPGKNGYEVCEILKGDPALRSIPVLLLAGTFEPLNKEEAARVRADDSIIKPFESQELLDKVRNLLTRGEVAAKPEAELEALGEEPLQASPLMPEPKLEIAEDIWEAGDFLGLPEDFEKPSKEGEAAPDLGFLEAGLFEEPQKDLSLPEHEFLDLEIQEEELKPGEEAKKPEPSRPPVPKVETFEREAFKAETFEPVKSEPFEVEPFEVESLKAETSKAEAKKPEPFEVEPFEVESFKPEVFERESAEARPFWAEGARPEVERPEPEVKEEPAKPEAGEALEEGPTQIEFVEEPVQETKPFEPQIPERTFAEGLRLVHPAPEPRPEVSAPASVISEAQVARIIEEVTGRASETIGDRVKEEVRSKLESGALVPREEVQGIIAKVAKEVIEEIAWEVVPEIAEDLIKAEIAKFKEALAKLR